MKVIGILRVKNEADLLPAVLENVIGGVEEIFAYDDNSTDGTREILEAHPAITIVPFNPGFTMELQKTRVLEQQIKDKYPYQTEEIWTALLAGDLFWLNKTPFEAAWKAHALGYDLQNGVAIDFGRWKWDEATDTWPNWHMDIRHLCQWCAIIEKLPVVWKVADYTRWKRLPWPGGFNKRNTKMNRDFPFLEHQGKRSPKYHQSKYATGSRPLSKKSGLVASQFDDYDFAFEHGKNLGFWENDKRIPWEGLNTIDRLLELRTMSGPERVAVYRSYDDQRHDNWPRRTDL
jgi:glycosyltransferase involved in cell wall biosynthesis